MSAQNFYTPLSTLYVELINVAVRSINNLSLVKLTHVVKQVMLMIKLNKAFSNKDAYMYTYTVPPYVTRTSCYLVNVRTLLGRLTIPSVN